jgi:hypothetical protein
MHAAIVACGLRNQTWKAVAQSVFEVQVLLQSVLQAAPLVPLGYEPQLSTSPHALQQHIGVLGTYGGGVGGGEGGGGVGLGEGLGEGGLGEGLGEGASPAMRSTIAL